MSVQKTSCKCIGKFVSKILQVGSLLFRRKEIIFHLMSRVHLLQNFRTELFCKHYIILIILSIVTSYLYTMGHEGFFLSNLSKSLVYHFQNLLQYNQHNITKHTHLWTICIIYSFSTLLSSCPKSQTKGNMLWGRGCTRYTRWRIGILPVSKNILLFCICIHSYTCKTSLL